MTRRVWKVPLLSRIAIWIAAHVLPWRVLAAAWLMILTQLDEWESPYLDDVQIHDENSIEFSSVVRSHTLEMLRRKIWREKLYATLEER